MKAYHLSVHGEKALRKAVLELVNHCPMKQENPDDCPLSGIRKLTPTKRQVWVNGLPKNDLSHLAAYHHVCLKLAFESGHPRSHGRHH